MKRICFEIILIAVIFLGINFNINATEKTNTDYGEAYRNHLSYSAKEGWNNDPNGLIYVNGVYHMYYQYNWDEDNSKTDTSWGNMSWGHATSTDLVHWQEQKVALPKGLDGYDMMFSGSAVYDVNNTSKLFDETEDKKLKEGHGIVAILTQPTDQQRQILAYSLDDGNSFKIYGEILSANNEGSLNDDEFRDPKVFWSETHQKWLMVIGGGAVRMYSSDNLKNWDYLGQTGFWGECPDISMFKIGNETKYALVLSPEDKTNSHIYNGTNRNDTFYPAEYYTIGSLNSDGLFIAEQKLKRFSDGFDSYAFQSFNNVLDGKVYGLSWSACWKNVDSYKEFRKTHNGGMTIACELTLEKKNDEYIIKRYPVSSIESLRSDCIFDYNDNTNNNIFNNVTAEIADMELAFDFNNSNANTFTLELRKSIAEKILIKYDKDSKELIFDRTNSSLLAENTLYYNWINKLKDVDLIDNKLSLRIIMDRAFISIFVNGGENSIFSAIFPSAVSNKMNFYSDDEIKVSAKIYEMNSIYKDITSNEAVITTNKLDIIVGGTKEIIYSSFDKSYNVDCSVLEGKEYVDILQDGNIIIVKGKKQGVSTIKLNEKEVIIYIYDSNFNSDISYNSSLYGYKYETDEGLHFEYFADAFLFSDEYVNDFKYQADINITDAGQAAGLVFGISDNYYDYYVVSVDVKDNLVKLWRAGIGDLKVSSYEFSNNNINLSLIVEKNTLKVFVDNKQVLVCLIEEYSGGLLGLNVYNSNTIFNNITFNSNSSLIFNDTNDLVISNISDLIKIINITDNSYKLVEDDFVIENNKLILTKKYLNKLENGKEYLFRVFANDLTFDFKIKTDFNQINIDSSKIDFNNTEEIYFILDEEVTINKVYIDSVEIADYTIDGKKIIIDKEYVDLLTNGNHEIKIYTDKGRPSLKFSLSEVIIIEEEEIESNHIFFYVDIAIFSTLIIGYIIFNIYRRKKGGRISE